MLQRCSALARTPLQARAYSTLFGTSAVLCQRGNYQGGGRGNRSGGGPRQGGFGHGGPPPPQQQQRYQQQHEGGYGNSGYSDRGHGGGGGDRGYDNRNQRRGGDYRRYDDRPQRHGTRRDGNEGRYQGRDDRRQGDFGNRQRGFGNRSYNRDDGESLSHRGNPEYLVQDAEKLHKMKQDYKKAKSERERVALTRDARSLLRRVRIDPSTQDERAVAIVLNCASMFNATAKSEGVIQAAQWMRNNIRGISPQNLALFTNALGVLLLPDVPKVLVNEVMPAVQAVIDKLTPVEVVMVLQAFSRRGIPENEKLQDELLLRLEPCLASMPAPQLSTAATVIQKHSMQARNQVTWRRIADAAMAQIMDKLPTMHSREVVTVFGAAAHLSTSEEALCTIIARVTETAHFHTDDHVAEILVAMSLTRKRAGELSAELKASLAELSEALSQRLKVVSPFVSLGSARRIWKHSDAAGYELSVETQQTMIEALLRNMAYHTVFITALDRLVEGLHKRKLPSTEFLVAVANMAVGVRPPRPAEEASGADGGPLGEHDGEDDEHGGSRHFLYVKQFVSAVALRLRLEEAFANNNLAPCEALSTTLPSFIVQAAEEVRPQLLLNGVKTILTAAPDCPIRNKACDEAVVECALRRMSQSPDEFRSGLNGPFVERFQATVSDKPHGSDLIMALNRIAAM